MVREFWNDILRDLPDDQPDRLVTLAGRASSVAVLSYGLLPNAVERRDEDHLARPATRACRLASSRDQWNFLFIARMWFQDLFMRGSEPVRKGRIEISVVPLISLADFLAESLPNTALVTINADLATPRFSESVTTGD